MNKKVFILNFISFLFFYFLFNCYLVCLSLLRFFFSFKFNLYFFYCYLFFFDMFFKLIVFFFTISSLKIKLVLN